MKWLQSSEICLALIGVMILAVAVSAAEDTWTEKADMPTARNLLATCEVKGRVYAIGGCPGLNTTFSAVEEYDPATDTWAPRASLPEARCGLSAGAVDGKLYAIGGAPSAYGAGSSRVYAFDPATDMWTRKADMPTARAYLSASVVNGKIYVIGGAPSGAGGLSYKAVEEYDPATDTWTKKADMPTGRSAHSAGVVNGKIYVMGGAVSTSSNTGLKTVEEYDPATDTWTPKADMPARNYLHSVSAVGRKIYSIGGGPSRGTTVPTVEEYNPVTDTWTTRTPMPAGLWGLSTCAVGGKIYAIGGALVSNVAVSTVEEYDTGLTAPSPDFNGDGKVDIQDLLRMIESWGQNDPSVDIAPPPFGDGKVDAADLEVLMSYWGQEVNDPTEIVHWKLDEAEGVIAADSAGTSDGVLVGNAIWQPAGGKVKGALLLDGVDDCLSTKYVLSPSAGPFSVFAWVKGGAPGQVILSQSTGVNWLMAGTPSGALMTELRQSGRQGKPLASSAVITDGTWRRVGVVWDGTSRILYADGVEVARDTQTGLGASADGLYIGAGSMVAPGTLWKGLIDDVRIYNRAVKP